MASAVAGRGSYGRFSRFSKRPTDYSTAIYDTKRYVQKINENKSFVSAPKEAPRSLE